LDLFKQSLFGIVAQIELLAELLNELKWLISFEHFDLFDIFSIQLDLQNTNWLFHSWREVCCGLPALVVSRIGTSVVVAKGIVCSSFWLLMVFVLALEVLLG